MARNKIKAKNTRPKSNLKTGRNYSYDKAYESTPEQIKRRASRNAARRAVETSRGRSAIKGKDVNHRNGNPTDNSRTNLSVESKKKNRGRKKKGKK
jgi:hypothetical protein